VFFEVMRDSVGYDLLIPENIRVGKPEHTIALLNKPLRTRFVASTARSAPCWSRQAR